MLRDALLWTDTAPRVVEARVQSATDFVTLRLWNCWRDPAGTVQAWIGDAGMLIEETGSGFALRCSDGFDAPTFDDLVVTVAVRSSEQKQASKQP